MWQKAAKDGKIKIALYNLTTTIKAGGIETFNWGIAKHLAGRGVTVHIYGGKGGKKTETPPGVSIFTYRFVPRDRVIDLGSRFKKFVERLSFGLFAFRDLVKNRYDFIYIHKPFDLPVALLASKLSGAKVIFGSQGTEFYPFYKSFAKRADFLFSCSDYNASEVQDYCGLRPRTLYNGVDTERFRPAGADAKLREALGVKEGQKVLVSACRLVGWKGIQFAIKAASSLAVKFDFKYLIIGEGEYRAELEALVKKLGLEDRIKFLGLIQNSDLPKYYSIADVALFPSVADETFGIAIAEAMACAVPVVAARVGGIPEVVSEGTGTLVPPRDDSAIAAAVDRLLSDEKTRKEWGAAARRSVVERFSWDVIADRFEGFIKK